MTPSMILVLVRVLMLASVFAEQPSVYELPHLQGHVEIRQDVPSSKEFYETYASGWGRPVVFKGLAAAMPAWHAWSTDEIVKERFGTDKIEVELAKKETRKAGNQLGMPIADLHGGLYQFLTLESSEAPIVGPATAHRLYSPFL